MKTFLPLLFLPAIFYGQVPNGYYDQAEGLQGYALKSKLHEIISTKIKSFNYGNIPDFYRQTDVDSYYENDGSLLDIYSENPTGDDSYQYNFDQMISTASAEGQGWNREHGVPQSTFYGIYPMYSDLNYLIPTDAYVNQRRSNYPYAKSNGSSRTFSNGSKLGKSQTPGYTNTVYEPLDEFKGDVARYLLYYAVRYEGSLNIFNHMIATSVFDGSEEKAFKDWYITMLLEWHASDPVSQKEIDRNNHIYSIQQTRNPFIDHPEYVQLIWSETGDGAQPEAPLNFSAPKSGKSFIQLQWSPSTSTDVLGYRIYENGNYIGYSKDTQFYADRLSPNTNYVFTVQAYDKDFLFSEKSQDLTVTTLAEDDYASDLLITKYIEGTDQNSAIEIANKTGHEVVLNNYYLSIQMLGNNENYYFDNAYQLQGKILPGERIVIVNPFSEFDSYTNSDAEFQTNAPALTFNGYQYIELAYGKKYVKTASTNNYGMYYTTVDAIGVKGQTNYNSDISLYRNEDVQNPNSTFTISEWTQHPLDYTIGLGEDDVLSVDQTGKKDILTAYPNPVFDNKLYIKGNKSESIQKASIYNYAGQLVGTEILPFKNKNFIDVSKLRTGNYVLHLDQQSIKFIKK